MSDVSTTEAKRELWFSMTEDQRFAFIQKNIFILTSKGKKIPLQMAEFQRKWFLDGPLFHDYTLPGVLTHVKNRICLKCRNVGASAVLIACEATLTAWVYGNVFIPFIASTKDQAKDLIKHCKKIIEHARFDITLKGGLKNQNLDQLSFENGTVIKAFPGGNPDGIRGPRALTVYCLPYDEKILTDVGYVPIGDVVEHGIGTYALSVNYSGKCEWKKIKNRFKNLRGDRKIIQLNTSKSSIRCTEDHKIVKDYSGVKVSAKDMVGEKIYKLNVENSIQGKCQKAIYSNHNNMHSLRVKENNSSEKETQRQGSENKDMFTLLREEVETTHEIDLSSTQEKYVYDIEVEDNHNYFCGDILISNCDEAAFVPNQRDIISAMEYFVAEGGTINLLSTPWGKANVFWKIWSDKHHYVSWNRHIVTLFKDMTDFDITVPFTEQRKQGRELSAPWIDLDFIEQKRQEDAPYNYANVLQELCAVPIEEATAALSEDVLNTNSMDYYSVDGRPCLPNGDPDPAPVYVFGADFASNRNMTAVAVFEAKDERLIACYTERFRGPFPEQFERMREIIERFSPQYFLGDETGMGGEAWISSLQESINEGTILGISYAKKDWAQRKEVNNNNKNFLVERAINYMAQGLIVVPRNHRQLRDELLGIQKLVYENSIRYSGKNGPVGADDLAFAGFKGMLLYDFIYEIGECEYAQMASSDFAARVRSNKRGKVERAKIDMIKKSHGTFEMSSSMSDRGMKHQKEIKGFHNLI